MTQLSNNLRGAGGGGGGDHTPVEASDSLQSKQYAMLLDLVSEGQIYGLADQINPKKSVYLNEVPMMNPSGTENFTGVSLDFNTGTQSQGVINAGGFSFDDVRFVTPVSVEVKNGVPITRTLSTPNCTSVSITISVPALADHNATNGDTNGTTVAFTIDVQTNGGGFVNKVSDTISGKTNSKYQRLYSIALTGAGPWDIRVTRTTADSASQLLQNQTFFDSYTGVIGTKLSYPNSALIGMRVDSQQFQTIPNRGYDLKGLLVRYPTNYDPVNRTYTGIWDGTFTVGYTNNPAWCFYDLLTNNRYGLGDYLDGSQVDKWSLYAIGQYCDQMVSDGYGGTEPRFTCNLYLQSAAEAFKVVSDMATIFRGISYWASGTLTPVQDRPSDPIALFTNANVIDGAFSYSGSSIKNRHTVALVTWSDLSDFGRQKVEYVQDDDGVRKCGVVRTEVTAMGCTSRGQAHRAGQHILYTEKAETETVTFKAGLDGLQIYPGAIISTSDLNRSGTRMGGRVLPSSASSIVLDSTVTINNSNSYKLNVMMPDGTLATSNVTSGPGATNILTVSPAFAAAPQSGALFVIAANDLVPEVWRVLSVTESDKNVAEISCLKHDPNKYALIESGIQLPAIPISNIKSRPDAPTNLSVVTTSYQLSGDVLGLRAVVSWTGATSEYRIKWRKSITGTWNEKYVTQPTLDINSVDADAYDFEVRAVSPLGIESDATALSLTITPTPIVLPDVTGLALETSFNVKNAKFIWNAVPGALSYDVQVLAGPTLALKRAFNIGDVRRYDYSVADMVADGGPWRQVSLKVRANGRFGAASANYAQVTAGNPQLAALNGISIDSSIRSAFFRCAPSTEDDFAGVIIWVSTDPTCPAIDGNKVYDGFSTFTTINKDASGTALATGTTYYLRCAGYDSFGKDSLNISSSIQFTVAGILVDAQSVSESQLTASLAARISLIDASAAVAGSVAAQISAEAANRNAGDISNANSITTLSARGIAAGNKCYNSEFTLNLDGWGTIQNNAEFSFYRITPNSSQAAWCVGTATAVLFQNGISNTVTEATAGDLTFLVEAGKTYEMSAYTGAHRCQVRIYCYWFDINGSALGSTYTGQASQINDFERFGGTSLDLFKRIYSIGVAPAGAVKAGLRINKQPTKATYSDSYCFFNYVMFAEAVAGQTTPSPYVAYIGLTTAVNANSVAITTEQTARLTAETALGVRIDTVTSSLANATASISSEAATRAAADNALSSQVSTVQARLATRANLIKNSGFENGLTSWIGNIAGAQVVDGVWGRYAIFAVGNGTGVVANDSRFSCVPGATYTVCGDSVLQNQSAGWIYFDVEWLDASLSILSTSNKNIYSAGHNFAVDDTNRIIHQCAVVAPANSAYGRVRFVWENIAGSNVVIGCRQIKVEQGGLPATPYSIEGTLVSSFAAILTEQTARATADSALASTVTTVQTQLNGNTASISSQATSINGLSAQYTLKTDVNGYIAGIGLASTVSNGTPTSDVTILADRFSVVQPGLTKRVPFIVTSVNNVSTIGIDGNLMVNGTVNGNALVANSVTGDRFQAGTITTNLFASGSAGSNLLDNSAFASTYTSGGYALPDGYILTPALGGINASEIMMGVNLAGDSWHPVGINGLVIHQIGTSGQGQGDPYSQAQTPFVACSPSQWVEASFYSGAHRCSTYGYLMFIDTSNNVTVGGLFSSNAAAASGGTSLSLFYRHSLIIQAPNNAVAAFMLLRKRPTSAGQTDSYAFFQCPMIAPALSGFQTQPSPWTPAGLGTTISGGILKTNSVTADRLNVSSLSAITATIGTLRTASTGARTEISDNVIKVYDTSGVLRVKMGNLSL